MLRADLHVHTCYSMDCATPLSKIVARCQEVGINCVAIADHGTITGALKLKELAPFKVIVAQEVLTPLGELMGLFLKEEIPGGLSPEETIARIRSQGGLVGIPHPFGRDTFLLWQALRSPHNKQGKTVSSYSGQGRRKNLLSDDILSQVDTIEVFNSRTPFRNSSTRAWELANEYRKVATAGSDAHTVGEIGKAYVEMPEFNGVDDFLNCLVQGKIFGRRSNLLVHFASTWARIKKRTFGDSSLRLE